MKKACFGHDRMFLDKESVRERPVRNVPHYYGRGVTISGRAST